MKSVVTKKSPTSSRLAVALRTGLAGASLRVTCASLAAVTAATALVACADENEPKTWVKRLDDPAQRAAAIKRLTQFFEDTMTKANKNREDASVKTLLDDIVDPMAKQYTAGNLDEKTRKELMKFLADTRDPRTAPALAKAFNEYEPGKNDEDVKYAAQAVHGLADAKKLTDQNVVDALWACFSKFQVSKAKSINLVKDLHDAVVAVSHPTYGPKAVEKLAAPVDPKNVDNVRDQLQFWQLTSVQVLSELRFVPSVKALVTTLLTPTKADLRAPVNTALMRMPKESEPVLISALNGSDPDLTKLTALFGPDKTHVAVLGDTLAWISRPSGRDAVLSALAQADNDTNRTILAQSLIRFPKDPRLVPAFLGTYNKIGGTASVALMGGANAHGALAQASAQFYDTGLTDWLLKEINTAKGDEADAIQLLGLESAIKLMTPAQKGAVGGAVTREGTPREKEMFKLASAVLDKCKEDAGCYVSSLDQPIPSSPPTASMGAIKASWMAGIYGNAGTRNDLLGKVDKVKEAGARLALVEAIDHLSPQGDASAAAALEKIVDADKASGNQSVLMADDAVVKVAMRLRARAL
jgi:hypothetical protein